MKLTLALALATLALPFALPAYADRVDYTESIQGSPVGDFNWTVQLDGFIQPPPPRIYVNDQCTNCSDNLFTPTVSSAPSNGDGCQITSVWLLSGYAPVTQFSPLCDGLYDAFTGGYGIPDPGVTGSFSFAGANPDGTQDIVTLTVSDPSTATPGDPPAVPEPRTWTMLLCGLGLVWLGRKIKL